MKKRDEPLTDRQAQAMRFIQASVEARGCAPTHAEIMEALGAKSKGTPAALIEQLVERGYLRRVPHAPRGIAIRRRLPGDLAGDAAAIAARLRIDARELKGEERAGMLTAADHYARVASGLKPTRRRPRKGGAG